MTCRTLEEFYHIDGHQFEKQYKEILSGYRNWDQLGHAQDWLLFPENIGPYLGSVGKRWGSFVNSYIFLSFVLWKKIICIN